MDSPDIFTLFMEYVTPMLCVAVSAVFGLVLGRCVK